MDVLAIARELEALAQTGLHYAQDPFDKERYARLRELSAELLAAQSSLSKNEILRWSASEFGYATPKVDVRAFVVQDDQVLLIREDADEGRWTLPGGWGDVNETPSQAVVRETEEECGYQVQAIRLLAVLDREKQGHQPPYPYHVYKHFFLCRIIGGAPTQTAESSESAFFPRGELPELSLSRVLPRQIAMFFEMLAVGDTSTRFD